MRIDPCNLTLTCYPTLSLAKVTQGNMVEASKANWTDAFPAPTRTAPLLPREAALPELDSADLLLVDVRRTDYEGGTIKGSLNLPAQSFYTNRAVLYRLCKHAGVKQVAFYCGTSAFIVHRGMTCRETPPILSAPWRDMSRH